MREQMNAAVSWHWATLVHLLRATSPWVLAVPAIGALVVVFLNSFQDIAPYLTKETAEISSPLILGLGVLGATWLAVARPDTYYKWLAVFALCLFLRELHFRGTNTGFYIAVVVLLVWASHARDRLEPFFSNRMVVTLLMSALWTYAVSKTFDRHVWDSLMTGVLTRDLFEENLEILGHLQVVLLVLVSALVEIAPAPGAAPAPRNT